MQTISLEYCHVTPATDWSKEIDFANYYGPHIQKTFSNARIQKCIMVDDLNLKNSIDENFIKEIVDKLIIKPDCIYLESSFIFQAASLVDKINPKIAQKVETNERNWLKKIKNEYGSKNEFILNWKKKDDTIMFSCPTLVATSYLTRLGYLDSTIVEPIYGEKLKKSDQLLNLLSSIYLQVEANAQLIIESTFPKANRQIFWNFYY